ncbi:MAG: methylase [Flaviaesturariibacter sp.]|nr:methylase [Flaviaesturariibacter sp.]
MFNAQGEAPGLSTCQLINLLPLHLTTNPFSMPLFQPSVLKKYIAALDAAALAAAWDRFHSHFGNAAMQQHIRHLKEEQYQEGFLRDLFVTVLGYTLNPQPGFNLTTEQKNEKGSKKADGAILKDGAVRGVIELKGTDTTDLSKIESQAFNYLAAHKGCTYAITANFEKLRLYIGDATEHEEFHLFALTKERFALLYLLLHAGNLLADLPLQLKTQSVAQEDAVTKKLYADYSAFKTALYADLVAGNPGQDRVELFRKTQKLLDRFLFVLFAEDRALLPPNSVRNTLKEWTELKAMDEYVPLYSRFKKYFSWINTGYRSPRHDIFAYNGGLFSPDDLLDTVTVSDDLLYKHTLALSNYDFESEVDVNILGHIFEHSLNEIEAIKTAPSGSPGGGENNAQGQLSNETAFAGDTSQSGPSADGGPSHREGSGMGFSPPPGEPEGARSGMGASRRKREGVFYTPRYITRYIVENTVGALCTAQKAALGMVEEDYAPQKKKKDEKALLKKLVDYRGWLLGLTILDPACGSGAFLNGAGVPHCRTQLRGRTDHQADARHPGAAVDAERHLGAQPLWRGH